MLLRCAVGGNLYRPNIVRDIRGLAIIEDRMCLLVGTNRSVPACSIKLLRSLNNHVILTSSGELVYLSSSALSQSVKRDTPCNHITLVKAVLTMPQYPHPCCRRSPEDEYIYTGDNELILPVENEE